MTVITDRPEPPHQETFAEELKDAVNPRSLLLGLGTGLLCLAFLLSYLGAFHRPTPHRLPLAVVAPAQVSGQVVAGLDGIAGGPVRAIAVPDEATAQQQLRHDEVSGVLVVDGSGTQDRLLVASGGGVSVSTALQKVVGAAEARQQRTVQVTDAVPHQAGDATGAAAFYVAISSVLAGYLFAAALGTAGGARPATFRRTVIRLGATVPYAAVVGLGVALVTGPLLGALTGHLGTTWGVAALLVLAAATVTMAFQSLLGFFGIAATILLFVVVGNPSAGGAYPYRMLPAFWRTVGPWLPNGAGVDALRRAVYFAGTGVGARLAVLVAWAVAGVALALAAAAARHRRTADG